MCEAHGSPETPDELAAHQALMQGTEAWQLMDGDKVITVRPQGRFKADNGTALVAAAGRTGIAYLPDWLTHEHVASGALVPVMTRIHRPRQAPMSCARRASIPARKIRVLTELLIEYCDPRWDRRCPRRWLLRQMREVPAWDAGP
jgi:DNA-binding transcriptional LysR family regulator